MPVDHQRIRSNGWRQGRVFCKADTEAITGKIPDNSRLVLVSHDCDIVHAGHDEPYVELCIARQLKDGPDGLYRWARHPRRLDIEIQIDSAGVGFCIESSARRFIERAKLQGIAPDQTATIHTRELTQLSIWLGKRYTRVALPDAFNERRRKTRDRVKRVLRRNSQHISGLMVALQPKGELKAGQNYEIHLVALMLIDDFNSVDRRGQITDAVEEIAHHLQECDGIEVVDSEVRSEAQFTLHDARYFVELSFDDLSLRENPQHPRLP